ncbi:MAG: DUF4139 domain-containing protein [candidate division WOR-3 bacterium]|nr:DUF4139 domain-containing protein [candidate division WOR-3 bacterium]
MIVLFCLFSTVAVNSKVDSIVLYSDRVMVTRVTDINLDMATELIFADLPGALDDFSVRVRAQGLKVGEVQVKRGYVDKPHPMVKQLEDSLKVLEISNRQFADEISVLHEKEKFLQSIAVGGPELVSKEILTGRVAPESWRQGLRFMVDELITTKRRSAEIERLRVELQQAIGAVTRELIDLKSTVGNRKSIVFDCHPDSPGNYRIKVSYVVRGANWRTYYEVRANPSVKKIKLTYFSKIYQRTNEDWENAKVVLSTAKPGMGEIHPIPVPWFITSRAKRSQVVYSAPTAVAEEGIEVRGVTAVAAVATPVEAGVSVWYPLPGRYTVRSGEPEKKIRLLEREFDGDFKYSIIPRVTLFAYLTGELQNKSDYLFLSGEASTYVGDDFTGRVQMPTIAPDESTTVSFGVDERVRVERELQKSKVSHGGLFSSKTKHEFVYENNVKNFHDKEIECTIVDQIPVSQDPDLKVSSVKLEPKPTEENKDRGIYYWRVPIAAGAEYKIMVSFTVEAPADREIDGLLP